MVEIVLLEKDTLSVGDMDFTQFEKIGKVKYYEANLRGVTVCNAPSYSTKSVAQLTMTYILELSSNLSKYNRSTHEGKWIESSTFSYFPYKFSELDGKTLGIFGMGTIGKEVAKMGMAFGLKIIAYSRTPKRNGIFSVFFQIFEF